MAEIKIAGIMRSGAFSPNHIGNDASILNLTAEQLRKRGCEVKIYSEEQLIAGGGVHEDIVIDMCRDQRSFPILQRMEDKGALVINSAYAVENCTRERLTRILIGSNIPTPASLMVNTNETVVQRMKDAGMTEAWVKRGDFTMHKEDVTFVRHPEEAQEVLQEYFLRGIKRAVINRHVEGELLKFYGVAGTSFFFNFFHFGSRDADGRDADKPDFDHGAFRAAAEKAADILGVKIYGGDAIIAPDGTFTIIDFNDWPSFAPCRAEASAVIARAVLAEIKSHNAQKTSDK